MTTDSEQIVATMDRIRRAKSVKLAQLSQQSQRLTDWREYVRSAPMASLVGSVLVGALVGKRLAESPRLAAATAHSVHPGEIPVATNGPRSSLIGRFISAATAMAVPIVTNEAKYYLLSGLNALARKMVEHQHSQLELEDLKHDQQSIQ